MYSEDKIGKITAKPINSGFSFLYGSGTVGAGGILADGTSTTVRNCVVSGYTLNSNMSVSGLIAISDVCFGGIVGKMSGGSIFRCEAVTEFDVNVDVRGLINSSSVYIGGAVGSSNGDVSYCISGGKIGVSSDIDFNIGGIVGNAAKPEYCFSYMEIGTPDKANIYGICPTQNSNYPSNCAYNSALAPSADSPGVDKCGNLSKMHDWLKNHGFQSDDKIFGALKAYAVVRVPVEYGKDPVFVHYGWWPGTDGDRYN